MTQEIRRRRGTTAQHASFVGAEGEITIDTDKKVAVVHDGATPGGVPTARADRVLAKSANLADLPDIDAARENIGVDDGWATQPIGVPIPLMDDLVGVAQPPTDKGYRYVKLSASDAYNAGLLTGESVSGSAPLVIATAVIDDEDSPLNGETIHLINSERRFLRAGATGTVENDQMQQISGTLATRSMHVASVPLLMEGSGAISVATQSSGPLSSPVTFDGGAAGRNKDVATFNSANSDGARAGSETRGKNIGATYYMRIR